MIKGILSKHNEIDTRHTVSIETSITMQDAIQVNEDGSFESVWVNDFDNMQCDGNTIIIDATEEEIESYRRYRRDFRKGDKIIINRGRKMKGEIKIIEDMFTYRPDGTYGHNDTHYLVFTDKTKVNRLHCDFV